MNCPKCQSLQVAVVDSRPYKDTIRRRRLCSDCGFRFSTLEVQMEGPRKGGKSLMEKTVIHTVEITRIVRDGEPMWPMEEINHRIVEDIQNAVDCDHVNVAKAQVFEMTK